MSQPELDSSYKFDIPSPPPVATNKSESPFTFPRQSQTSVPINTQPGATEPLTNSSTLFHVHKEPPKAPIASISELQLDDEELNIPVRDNSSTRDASLSGHVTHTETTSAVTETASSLPASQPPIVLDTSDHKAPLVNSVCTSTSAHHIAILQESCTKTELFQTESSSVTLSHHQPDPPGIAGNTTQSGEPKIYATITDSLPVPHNDNSALNADSAAVLQDFSVSCVERSIPETAKSASITSAVSSDNSTHPVSQDTVYGELYDSLFPQGFTSKVISSLSNPPPEIHREMGHLNTKSEPVMIKTLNECHTEANVTYSRLSASHEFAGHRKDDSSLSSTFTSNHSSASDPQKESDIHHRYLPSPLSTMSEPVCQDIHYSELSHSHSEVKSDNFSLIQETVTSFPEVQNCAPPVSDYVTSQGADAQVTDSKRRVILIKKLVTDETSTNPGCPSPVLHKMSTVKGLEIKIETPSGQMDGYEGLLSPAYLSVGSDDGSAIEIYYSAEEGNSEESGDEDMYTMDEREGNCMVDGVKEVQLHEEQGEIVERQTDKRREEDLRVVIVKMQNEGGNMVGNEERTEDFSRQIEVHQQLGGQKAEAKVHNTGMSEFPVSKDGQSQQKAAATTVVPQTEEGEEGRKEELLATPVEQVNAPMVCKAVPPSHEPHGQGEGSEGNWTQNLEREARLNGEKQFPSQELQYLSYKVIRSAEYMHAASSNSRGENVITPTLREAEELEEEQVSETAHKSREASQNSIETNNYTTTNAVSDTSAGAEVVSGSLTHSAELQSDATESEHNRAPQHSEWVDTITQSINRNRTVQEQVAVELSASNTDTHHPDTEAAEASLERRKHPPEAQPDLDQG